METIIITAEEKDKNERLDKFLSDKIEDVSRSYAAKLAGDGLVTSDGKVLEKKYKIRGSETISVELPEPEVLELIAEDIPLDIVYEDSDLIVVNKPQGMVVHPAAGNFTGTLVNALMHHCGDELSAINGVVRPGIVHRIDKDTAGLLVVAKNNEAHIGLSAQLKERKAVRKYYALVNGNIKEDSGTVDKPIARSSSDRKKMAIVHGGREAVTHFNVLERFGAYTLVECILETGRTHQIRVHMASIQHSLVGDKTYGIKKEKFNLAGQLLFAKTIGFVHPKTNEFMQFEADLPDYFEDVLDKLRKNN